MGKINDLTNKNFGQLTVIEQDLNYVKQHNIKNPRPYWKCKCSCGEIITVKGCNLVNGTTIRCKKCSNNKKINNLVGKTFNYLTVLELLDKRTSNRGAIYKCQCICGNVIEVSGKILQAGQRKHCGCLKGKQKIKNLIGQTFGQLLVIKQTQLEHKGSALWKCKCSCGNEITVTSTHLLSGHTNSCGCLKSIGEYKIIQLLIKNNIPFQTQKTFDSCRFPTTNHLGFFDFYINNQFLLEYDGIQHFAFNQSGWNNLNSHLDLVERDTFKNNWCKENKIPLKRIPYWKLSTLTIEDILGNKFLIEVNINEQI